MRKFKLMAVVALFVVAVVAATFFIIGNLKPKVAGIHVETNPPALLFVDGEQIGRTPYKGNIKPGEKIIKLVPESFEKPLAPYEIKINLGSGVETVIRREFSESDDRSSGEIISFEKIEKDRASLVAVTLPESVELTIDGYQKIITPYKMNEISPGEHTLTFSTAGYFDKFLRVKTNKGYKLTVIVQLALSDQEIDLLPEEISTTNEEKKKEQVEILSTPVGFLRVRAEPSSLGAEVGQVKPGGTFDLIEEDEKTGWYKIEFVPVQAGGEEVEATSSAKQGWVSNQYARKTGGEFETTLTSTPSATSTTGF